MHSVLIVDDSALTRKILRETIGKHSGFSVADYATNGEDALEKVKKLDPDVITLDIEMDKLNGLEFLERLMDEYPKPVVIVSSHAEDESQITFDALERGAVDFLLKPKNLNLREEFEEFKEALLSKLEAALQSKPKLMQKKKKKVVHKFKKPAKHIVIFGASTGGPSTLKRLFSELPGELPFSMLVVQHMPLGFTKPFAEHLDKISDFNVKEAVHNEEIEDNTAYICPADYHMVLYENSNTGKYFIKLTKTEKVHGVRPSFDVLVKSVVPIFKERVIMVVLTGMGKDGLAGARLVNESKGKVLVESEDSCIIYGMPKAIAEENLADAVVSLEKLPVSIVQEVDN